MANLKAVGKNLGRKGWTWTKETANEVRQLTARDNTGKVKARVRYEDHQYVYDEFYDGQWENGVDNIPGGDGLRTIRSRFDPSIANILSEDFLREGCNSGFRSA